MVASRNGKGAAWLLSDLLPSGTLPRHLLLLALLVFFASTSFADSAPSLPLVASKRRDSSSVVATAHKLELAKSPTWRALLHYRSGRCQISDTSFILTGTACNPTVELERFLQAWLNAKGDQLSDMSCRFPARMAFIRHYLASVGYDLPFSECPSLTEYLHRAPADDISLVFAAENVAHPMSMMGHLFLAFHGVGDNGRKISHAASFYTRFTSSNPVLIARDSFITGMPSYFSLVPFSEQLSLYVDREQRNVWEYHLALKPLSRRLMHLHVWELKFVQTPYYFVGYNCATVIHFILAIAAPELLEKKDIWIAPVNVARRAQEVGLVDSRSFHPSRDWRIRSFGDALARYDMIQTRDAVKKDSVGELGLLGWGSADRFRMEFAKAVLEEEKANDPKRGREVASALDAISANLPDVSYTVENARDPLNAARFPQLVMGAALVEGRSYGSITLLPASHLLSEDNSHTAIESSVELGRISLLLPADGSRPLVDRLMVYSFDSIIPDGPLAQSLSSRFSAGVERHLSRNLSWFPAGTMQGGVGKAFALSHDLTVYGMANVGLNYGDGQGYLTGWPEVGFFFYEILSMKTTAAYRVMCGQDGSADCYQGVSLTQTIRGARRDNSPASFAPYLTYEAAWRSDESWHRFGAGIRWSF